MLIIKIIKNKMNKTEKCFSLALLRIIQCVLNFFQLFLFMTESVQCVY